MSSPTAINENNNKYENKNYNASFYPGAVHIVGDSAAPILVVGNKDYYIEANARSSGSANSDSVGTILEYLFNGLDNVGGASTPSQVKAPPIKPEQS